jgi:hypothetical protein
MTLNKEGITREAEVKQKNNCTVMYPKRYNVNVRRNINGLYFLSDLWLLIFPPSRAGSRTP